MLIRRMLYKKRRSIGTITFLNMIMLLAFVFLLMIGICLCVYVMTYFEREKSEADHELSVLLTKVDPDDFSHIFSETKRLYEEIADEYTDQEVGLGEWKSDQRKRDFYAHMSPVMDQNYEMIRRELYQLREYADDYNTAFIYYDDKRDRLIYVIDGNTPEFFNCPGEWTTDDFGEFPNHAKMEQISRSKWFMDVRHATLSGWTASDYTAVFDENGELGFYYADMKMDELLAAIGKFLLLLIPLGMVLIAGSYALFSQLIQNALIAPMTHIAAGMDAFTALDGEKLMEGERVFRDIPTTNETPLEIAAFIENMQKMEEGVAESLRKIHLMTKRQEKIESELAFAAKIQQTMLPALDETFTKGDRFTLYATMSPARAVGGDFYDFFMLDDKRLVFLVADVTDKGMPAALYMAVSKAILKTRMLACGSLSEIMRDINELLANGNAESMFVTVFVVILDLETGIAKTCNAGHDYPMVLLSGQNDSKYIMLEENHGFPLAFLPGMIIEYPENTWQLSPGDRVFLYTDGVNESKNRDDDCFGTERMLEVLNAHKNDSDKALCEAMIQAVADFSEGEPPFDDTTMISVTYTG